MSEIKFTTELKLNPRGVPYNISLDDGSYSNYIRINKIPEEVLIQYCDDFKHRMLVQAGYRDE